MATRQSPIFGLVRDLTDVEEIILNKLITSSPDAVFGAINKTMNRIGYMLTIDTFPKSRQEVKNEE
jgi:hypothetical protein